jgi:hypothetical protein
MHGRQAALPTESDSENAHRAHNGINQSSEHKETRNSQVTISKAKQSENQAMLIPRFPLPLNVAVALFSPFKDS